MRSRFIETILKIKTLTFRNFDSFWFLRSIFDLIFKINILFDFLNLAGNNLFLFFLLIYWTYSCNYVSFNLNI